MIIIEEIYLDRCIKTAVLERYLNFIRFLRPAGLCYIIYVIKKQLHDEMFIFICLISGTFYEFRI